MSIERHFTIGLNAGYSIAPVIHVNQYDHNEVWYFTLMNENGEIYTPTTGGIVGVKSDGNAIVNSGTVDSNGRVVINETQQMTAAAGNAVFELILDSSAHGTANFVVQVEAKPGDNASLSDSDISLIEQAIVLGNRIVTYGSPLTASTAAQMTDHEKVYVYTGSESGYTSGHWYYWNGSAWTDGGVYNAVAINTDKTLSVENMAADGKATGDAIADLKNAFDELNFETKTEPVTPTSHENYRYGYLHGELIASSGNTAWEFNAEENRDYILQGLQVGTSNAYAVLFIDASDAVISIINDAVQETGHLVPITTPANCVKVKYTSSTNATWDAYPKKELYKTLGEQSPVENNTSNIGTLKKIIGNDYDLTAGYLDATGNLVEQSGNKEVTTSFIAVSRGQVLNVAIEYNQVRNAWCSFSLYDENETFIRRIADTQESTASKTWTYTVTGNTAFVRVSYRTFDDVKSVSIYFDNSVYERITSLENSSDLNRKKYTRLMNRQGEGYGFPDNSIEGIKSALNDGFSKIRIAIASTDDDIIYCTHSYEMKNNATTNCLKLDGATYTQNVNINEVDSAFIERLLYKNYPIPTLDEALELVSIYDVELTLEMKEVFTATQAQKLIDTINYYRVPVIISGMSGTDQLQAVTAISTDLNLGVIFHYNDSSARYNINLFANSCKTLRFDCFTSDTIARSSVIGLIHPEYKLKLGGSNPSASDVKELLKWVDVCETARPYSEYM